MSTDGRSGKRQPTNLDGMIYDSQGNQLFACMVRNVSVSGAQLELPREAEIPENFLLALSRNGSVRRKCRKVWQYSVAAGVRFTGSAL